MSIYLDYAATTPLSGEALDAMRPYLTEYFANADSLHSFGRRADYAVCEARDRVARVLGVQPSEVYFTSGGTEADHWAVRGLSTACRKKGVAVSAIEHHAVLGAGEHIRNQAILTQIACDSAGTVGAEAVKEAITPDTGLVCVMAVNNETGVVQPIQEISSVCKEKGVLLFSDCVQAGTTQNLKELCASVDALSLSAHKLYGPKGVGALIVKNGVSIAPFMRGGEQERGLRGGTLNVPAIVGFSVALERAQAEREGFCKRVEALRNYFEGEVKARLGDRVKINGEEAKRAPSVSHLSFLYEGAEALLNQLDLAGVAASGGAACSAHTALPSHVLMAMGASESEAKRGIRFSLGKYTTKEEAQRVVKTLVALVNG